MGRTFGKASNTCETAPVAPLKPVIEKDPRRGPRKRTLLKGKLSFGRGAFTVDCIIRDLSGSGARVLIHPGVAIPAHVYLVYLRQRMAFEATVQWRRKDGQLGLKLGAAYDLEHCRTPELKLLRRYCVDTMSAERPAFLP